MRNWKHFAGILALFVFFFTSCPTPDGGDNNQSTGGNNNQPTGGNNNQTPTVADFNISGTGTFTYDGNSKTVTVTAKEGKTSGIITVKYNGTTDAPSAVDTYTVTFDVAAAVGWNAVSDLPAGTLTINEEISGNQTPTAADYNIGNLTQTFGSVTAVTITPKEGKSTGAVTIFYNGLTTLPTAVGTYIVTFNIAASDSWNAVSGLSAGTLTINGNHGISLSQTDTYTFAARDSDYTTQDILTITVTNTGNQPTGALTVALSGNNASSFTLSKTTINSITATNGTDTFTIRPKIGLSVGSYTAIVTVSGGANITSNSFAVSFNVINTADPYIITGSGTSFTVTKSGVTIGTANQPIQTVINAIRTHATSKNRIIQFGNGTAVLDIGSVSASFDNSGIPWGTVTLTGKITGSNTVSNAGTIVIANTISVTSSADIANTATDGYAVYYNSTGKITISDGTVSTTTGRAIYNASSGEITISGGTVSATTGNAVYNASSGGVTISGGTVSVTTGNAVYNASTGTVTISSGTVSATEGGAVWNNSIGKITVSGTARVTSARRSSIRGTIYIADSSTSGNGVRLEIKGGTVENTSTVVNTATLVDARAIYNASSGGISISGGTVSTTTGRAIYNASNGDLTISGGTVSATTGVAVYNTSGGEISISGGTVSATTGVAVWNDDSGKIIVSGTAKVTSANTDNEIVASGTVYLRSNKSNTGGEIEIRGGTVENTSASGIAVCNTSGFGTVIITGGTVSAIGGTAVFCMYDSRVYLGGSPTITGVIYPARFGYLSMWDFFPGTQTYTLDYGYYTYGSIAVSGGSKFLSNFTLYNQTEWRLVISGDNLIIVDNKFTIAAIPAQTYTGSEIKPVITVKDGSTTLSLNTHYTVSYSNNINAGTATVNVIGTGNYAGITGSATFTINPKVIIFTIDTIPAQNYTGNAITPTVTVKDGSTTLTLNTHYTVSYSNNTNAGTNAGSPTAYVTGTGNYAGSTGSRAFTINPKVIIFTIDTIPAQNYTGNAITPTVTVKDGSTTLTLNTHYTVSYSNNTNVGAGTVNVTGTGNYAGSTGSVIFTIGTYGISLSQTNTYTFADMDYSYTSAPDALTVTVTNTGNQPTGALTVSLSGNNASSFTLSKITINSITATNGTDTFTIRPKIGLSVGSYTAIVAVSGGANITSKMFIVNFTVEDPTEYPYIITGSGTSFTATKGGVPIGTANQPLQTVINAIRTHAAGKNRIIQFGNGTAVLDIGSVSANFDNSGGTWGTVTLTGKITSSNIMKDSGTIVIADAVSITTTADIANKGGVGINDHLCGIALYNASTGEVTISGGTVSARNVAGTGNYGGIALYNASTGKITVSGTAKITSAGTGTALGREGCTIFNDSSGVVTISGGTVENTSGNNTTITLYNASTGAVIISGGTVSKTDNGYAVWNSSKGGTVTISGGTISATGNSNYAVYAIYNASTLGKVTISNSAVIIGQRYNC
jgi:hypothetical protein